MVWLSACSLFIVCQEEGPPEENIEEKLLDNDLLDLMLKAQATKAN